MGIVAAKEAGVDNGALDHAGRAEADDREVVARRALAAALPAVHPFAAVGVLVLLPDRRGRFEEILLFREVVVGRVEHRAAEAFGSEIDQIAEVSHCPVGAPMCAPSSHTFLRRRNVARTTPWSRSPSYGVTLCRCSIASGTTVNVAFGSKTMTSASKPAASFPLRRSSCAIDAGPSLISRETSSSFMPWRCASVQTIDRPNCSDAIPPQARSTSPSTSFFSSGVHGE